MKRNFRSAKFAEYLSTFALIHQIHLHPTLLIEKRDPSRGYGMYVRDAVDAGTTMVVLPRRSLMTSTSVDTFGVGLSRLSLENALQNISVRDRFPAMNLLLMGVSPVSWIVLAWQLSVELSARHSFWWGWLSSVPSLPDLNELEHAAHAASRVVAPQLAGQMATIRSALQKEVDDAFTSIVAPHAAVVPTIDTFRWAVRLVLTRSIVVPTIEGTGVDLAIAPFIDLCNMATAPIKGSSHKKKQNVSTGNAEVEFLGDGENLPEWSRKETDEGGQFKTADSDYHRHAVMLTLHNALLPGDEVLLDDAAGLFHEIMHEDFITTPLKAFLSTNPSLQHPDMAAVLRMQRYHIPL